MKSWFKLLFVAIFFISCQPSKKSLLQTIKELEQKIQSKYAEGHIDTMSIQQLINTYEQFVEHYPDDTLCPKIYYNMARLLIQIDKPQEAVKWLDQFEVKYPDNELLPEVLFFRGYVEENELKDYKAAQETYVRFLQKYPSHPYAEQVRIMLRYLGYSADKLLELTQKQDNLP